MKREGKHQYGHRLIEDRQMYPVILIIHVYFS